MAAHTPTQREFIVRKLAAFYTPKDICAAFVAIFRDTACSEIDVLANDPRVTALTPEMHTVFYAERERVLTDPTLAPFADQAARLIVLSRQAERYEANNQPTNARYVLRQISEELGVVGGKSAGGGKKDNVPAAVGGSNEPIAEIRVTIVDPVKQPVETAGA